MGAARSYDDGRGNFPAFIHQINTGAKSYRPQMISDEALRKIAEIVRQDQFVPFETI